MHINTRERKQKLVLKTMPVIHNSMKKHVSKNQSLIQRCYIGVSGLIMPKSTLMINELHVYTHKNGPLFSYPNYATYIIPI